MSVEKSGFYAIIQRMFIQLTRTDGAPVWLNAAFIVTIEPTRGGGSIVVPIGDGLDYEVREKPGDVLAMLEGAPSASVVPVPPPKALTPRPDDVSPEAEPAGSRRDEAAPAEPAKKGRRAKTASRKAKVASGGDAKTPVKAPVEPKADAPAKPQLPDDFEQIVSDLKKRKCRTAKRMRNAMKSFFGKTDESEIDGIIEAMINSGYMLVEADGHVNWLEGTDGK